MAAEAAGDWGEAIGDWTAREEEKAALGTETRIWWINIWSFFFFFFWVTNTCRSSCCFPFSRVFRSTDVWESEVFDYICGTSLVSMNYISYGRSLTGMSASGMCIPTDGGCKLEPPNYNESRVWAQRRKKRDNRGSAMKSCTMRLQLNGDRQTETDLPSTLSALLLSAPPGLLLQSHLSASPSTSSLTRSQFAFQPAQPWEWCRWVQLPCLSSTPESKKLSHFPSQQMSQGRCSVICVCVCLVGVNFYPNEWVEFRLKNWKMEAE